MMVVRETRRVELEKKRVKLGERMSDIRRRRGEIERREEIERRKHDIRRRRMEKIKRREITMEGVKMESCQFSKDLLVLWFRQLGKSIYFLLITKKRKDREDRFRLHH